MSQRAGYITVPGYDWPIKAGPTGVHWVFDPKQIDVSSGEPIVRLSDGYWVYGRSCMQPGGGMVPAWGFVESSAPETHGTGADVDLAEAGRIRFMIQSFADETKKLGEDLSLTPSFFPDRLGGYRTNRIKQLGTHAVMNIGPALDAFTHGASQPATQHAWQINTELYAIPVTPDDLNGANPEALNSKASHAGYLAGQMAGLYFGALSAATGT